MIEYRYMKNNLALQLVYNSAFLAVNLLAFFISIGIWNIGGNVGQSFNPFFFTDFFVWMIVMSAISTAAALADNIRALTDKQTHAYAKRLPVLKFCTMCGMLFGFLLGAFFVNRTGAHALTAEAETSFGSIFPGIATAGYWTDLSVFLPRFLLPLAYMTGYVLFEERLKSRSLYTTIAILPPTVFYFFNLFFGMIMSAVYGGTQGLLDAGMYSVAYPYFFYDSALTYDGWWWMLIWPTIFGVSLMVLNDIVFRITRTVKSENGKCKTYRKLKVEEDTMRDFIHYIILKRNEKRRKSIEK